MVMTSLVWLLLPELILAGVACALFIVGLSRKASTRRLTATVALAAVALVFVIQLFRVGGHDGATRFDGYGGFMKGAPTGTVTGPKGTFKGKLLQNDGFTISLQTADGSTHTWPTGTVTLKEDQPLKGHYALLPIYTDKDIHDVFAYLETLK